MLDVYLSLEEIEAGTGTPCRVLWWLAKRDGWPSRKEYTGRRGRPRLRYRVAEVMESLGLVA